MLSIRRKIHQIISSSELSRSDKVNECSLTTLIDEELFCHFEHLCGWVVNLLTFSLYQHYCSIWIEFIYATTFTNSR